MRRVQLWLKLLSGLGNEKKNQSNRNGDVVSVTGIHCIFAKRHPQQRGAYPVIVATGLFLLCAFIWRSIRFSAAG